MPLEGYLLSSGVEACSDGPCASWEESVSPDGTVSLVRFMRPGCRALGLDASSCSPAPVDIRLDSSSESELGLHNFMVKVEKR